MLLAVLLAGCETLFAGCERQYPRDLEARVVGLVDESVVREVTGDPAYLRSTRDLMLIELSSATDWVDAADSKDAAIHLTGFLCDSEDGVVILTDYSLFVNGRRAGWPLSDGTSNLPHANADGRYVVKGFLWLRDHGATKLPASRRLDPDQEFYDSFDLAEDPRDVCLFVGGSTMWLPTFYYRSNVAVIPKEEIAAGLALDPGLVGLRGEPRSD